MDEIILKDVCKNVRQIIEVLKRMTITIEHLSMKMHLFENEK